MQIFSLYKYVLYTEKFAKDQEKINLKGFI